MKQYYTLFYLVLLAFGLNNCGQQHNEENINETYFKLFNGYWIQIENYQDNTINFLEYDMALNAINTNIDTISKMGLNGLLFFKDSLDSIIVANFGYLKPTTIFYGGLKAYSGLLSFINEDGILYMHTKNAVYGETKQEISYYDSNTLILKDYRNTYTLWKRTDDLSLRQNNLFILGKEVSKYTWNLYKKEIQTSVGNINEIILASTYKLTVQQPYNNISLYEGLPIFNTPGLIVHIHKDTNSEEELVCRFTGELTYNTCGIGDNVFFYLTQPICIQRTDTIISQRTWMKIDIHGTDSIILSHKTTDKQNMAQDIIYTLVKCK